MKKNIFLISILILIMSIQALFASDNKTFILGGKNGWNTVSDRRNITTTSGRYGYEAL